MKRHRIIAGAAVCFAILLAGNFSEIAAPPFWDDLMGFHRQALFLADHRFDFAALAATGDFWSGGVHIYRGLHLPSLLYGVGYALLPPLAVRCCGHLLNLILLTAAAAMLARMSGKYRWFPAAAALMNPLLMSQAASLGQEPWLVLAFTGVVFAIWRDRWRTAWIWVIFGACVKPVMIVPAAAMMVYALYLLMQQRDRRRLVQVIVTGVLLGGLTAMLMSDSDGAVQENRLTVALLRAVEHFWWYFPLLGAVLLASLAGSIGQWRRWRGRWGRRMLFLWLLQGAFWGCYVLYSVPLPRYAGAVVMPLYLLLTQCLSGRPRLLRGALSALCLCGVVMSSGHWLPALPPHLTASGEFLERSRESVRQRQMDQVFCRSIGIGWADQPIVAKWPYVMMLAEPRFGYVEQAPADIRCAGILPREMPWVRGYDPALPPPDGCYIFAWNSFEFFSGFGPPIAYDENDEILLQVKPAPVWLYRRKP